MPPRSTRRATGAGRPRRRRARWYKVLPIIVAIAAVVVTIWGNLRADDQADRRQAEVLRQEERVRAVQQEIALVVDIQNAASDVLTTAEASFLSGELSVAAAAQFRERSALSSMRAMWFRRSAPTPHSS